MQVSTEDNVLFDKTRDLCQAIMDHPDFRAIRERIDTFIGDDDSKGQYQRLSEKGEFLTMKQQQGLPLTQEEIAEFETQRETFLKNPVAKGFLDAQEEIQKVQASVGQFVAKTFELGRVPQQDDFQSGSCGTGCGCH